MCVGWKWPQVASSSKSQSQVNKWKVLFSSRLFLRHLHNAWRWKGRIFTVSKSIGIFFLPCLSISISRFFVGRAAIDRTAWVSHASFTLILRARDGLLSGFPVDVVLMVSSIFFHKKWKGEKCWTFFGRSFFSPRLCLSLFFCEPNCLLCWRLLDWRAFWSVPLDGLDR